MLISSLVLYKEHIIRAGVSSVKWRTAHLSVGECGTHNCKDKYYAVVYLLHFIIYFKERICANYWKLDPHWSASLELQKYPVIDTGKKFPENLYEWLLLFGGEHPLKYNVWPWSNSNSVWYEQKDNLKISDGCFELMLFDMPFLTIS